MRTVVHTARRCAAIPGLFRQASLRARRHRDLFAGAAAARPNPAFTDAIADPRLAAVIIAPSNPWLSIDPILAVPGVREALEHVRAPVIAVSPIIRGQAVKGPTAKIMRELGIEPTSDAIARHYDGLIDGLVIDESDAADADRIGVPVSHAQR